MTFLLEQLNDLGLGISRDLIVKGIQTGKLEYREGAVWGNPYLRVLRSQLEPYIAEQLGPEYLASKKAKTELRAISKEIAKKLGIGTRTAETYRADLMKALDIHDIAGLTRFAIQMGLVSVDG